MSDPQPRTPASEVPWHLRPVGVLLLLFVVLGPLGLPFLWRSPRFTQTLKVVLTIAVIAYTGLLVEQTVAFMHAVQDQLNGIR